MTPEHITRPNTIRMWQTVAKTNNDRYNHSRCLQSSSRAKTGSIQVLHTQNKHARTYGRKKEKRIQ